MGLALLQAGPWAVQAQPVLAAVQAQPVLAAVQAPQPASAAPGAAAEPPLPAGTRSLQGRLPSGAAWRFDIPAQWQGSVLLYSRGYGNRPGNPARNHSGAERDSLLAQGHALIGSSYARSGWAVEEAVADQLATLDRFVHTVGTPRRVVAWGSSMGALVTIALLERHPERFDGGLALCGSLSGTLGMMNQAQDGAFVLATLAAPEAGLPLRFGIGADGLPLPAEGLAVQRQQWQAVLDQAMATPLGRARVALAAAVAQVSPWAAGQAAPPAAHDLDAHLQGWAANLLAGVLLPRDDQERRAGGPFSWNTGVDYAQQLARSGQQVRVAAAYRAAGAEVSADLARLAAAPRLAGQPAAVRYMARHHVPNGEVRAPVLVLQSTVDPLTLPEFSADYARVAALAGRGALVRNAWVQRVGHCRFTVPELMAAMGALMQRLDGQPWVTDAASLNAAAQRWADGPQGPLGPQAPAGTGPVSAPERAPVAHFVTHQPLPLLRACSARPGDCPGWAGPEPEPAPGR